MFVGQQYVRLQPVVSFSSQGLSRNQAQAKIHDTFTPRFGRAVVVPIEALPPDDIYGEDILASLALVFRAKEATPQSIHTALGQQLALLGPGFRLFPDTKTAFVENLYRHLKGTTSEMRTLGRHAFVSASDSRLDVDELMLLTQVLAQVLQADPQELFAKAGIDLEEELNKLAEKPSRGFPIFRRNQE